MGTDSFASVHPEAPALSARSKGPVGKPLALLQRGSVTRGGSEHSSWLLRAQQPWSSRCRRSG